MTPDRLVDYVLQDCFFALGQIIPREKPVDANALAWWRERYREKFLDAMTTQGNSWAKDRRRVLAVGRYLGTRALALSDGQPTIDLRCATLAAAEVEAGCQMNAARESGLPLN